MRAVAGAWLVVLSSTVASATTYYVRTDGNNGNAGTTNSAGGAWATVTFASDNVVAGDVVRVQAGAYSEVPTPSDNGTSGNTITYVADGTVTLCGMTTASQSYLRFIGFTFDDDGAGCSTRQRSVVLGGVNVGLEFWNNTVSHSNAGFSTPALGDRCNACLFIGNVMTNINIPDDGSAGAGWTVFSAHGVLAYNNIGPVDSDGFDFSGTYLRFLNNYWHDASETSGGHSDFFQTDSHDLGQSQNLYEGNFQQGQGNLSDEHVGVWQNISPSQCQTVCGPATQQVWRRNIWHNISTGTLGIAYGSVADLTYNYVYNNTTATAQIQSSGQIAALGFDPDTNNDYVFNEIFYQAWSPNVTSNITAWANDSGNPATANYNLAFDPDGSVTFNAQWTNQANEQSNVDPVFVSFAGDDFHLQVTSGAIGTAGPLTTVSGSGTSATFNTATGGGGFFRGDDTDIDQYGGALITGDTITVGGDTCVIASIATDAITCTASFTFADGESVYFGTDTTPDIGAYPYKAGGYTLSATYTNSGGTVTVTPNDASLVRFVVCYGDSVPTVVDNASPFTCATPSGTIAVRVYPLYASTTLWAVATEGDPPASNGPIRLRKIGGAIVALVVLPSALSWRRRGHADCGQWRGRRLGAQVGLNSVTE